MKFFITSIGTRGDVEPFLAIGEILSKRGHDVAYAFSEQFENIIPKKALFYPLTPEIMELINSREGRIVMGKASVFKKIKALLYLHQKGKIINKEIVIEHQKYVSNFNPDVIIHNPKCSYPVIWNLKTNKDNIIVSPVPYVMYPVKNHPHVGINRNLGHILNKLTYKLSNFGLVNTIYVAQKTLEHQPKCSMKTICKALFHRKLIFSITPQLFNRPDSWPKHVQILGYHERNTSMNWRPSAKIKKFLNNHAKILFLTFGSMFNSNPNEISNLFYDALIKLNIPCIINTASGGLLPLEKYRSEPKLLFVKQIPYEWIFKRVYAVVHHGGSGTTHMGLKYGLPSLIIPHIIDQYSWNKLVHKNKFGPKGISIKKLSKDNITPLIKDLYENETYKHAVNYASKTMNNTKLEDELYAFIVS